MQRGERAKVCLISTVGGHLAQLAVLADTARGQDAYLVTVPSPHAASVLPGLRRYMVRQILRNPASLLVNAVQSLRILLRERPDAVVTTGAGDALPTVLFAAAMGTPVVFVESFARVERPSLFGRLARRWCDLVLYQWPDLRAAYPGGTLVAPLFRIGAPILPPTSPSLLVLTGTHTRGFERLLRAIDSLVESGRLPNRITAQIGHSSYVPRAYPHFRFLPHDELLREIDRADVVVTHDGSASIGESLSRGKPTVVVPREGAEVSYGSEQQLARHLAALGYVSLLENPLDLPSVVSALASRKGIPAPRAGADALETIRDFLARLGTRATPGTVRTVAGGDAASGKGLRITLITPANPWEDRPSGIGSYARALTAYLTEAGASVAVVTVGAAPERSPPGVVPVILSSRPRSSIGFLALLFLSGRKVRGRGDIIHLQRADHVLPVLPWAWPVPRIVTLHGEASRSVRLRRGSVVATAFRILQGLGVRYANALIAVDDRTRDEYELRFPRLRGRVGVIPVGVPDAEMRTADPTPRPVPLAPPASRLVVYAGRLEPEKNVGLLLEAFRTLRQDLPDAALLVVGTGRSEPELRRQAEAAGDSVRFLPPLPQADLWRLLRQADAVAVPSLFESGPLVALEAISLGTPVVTTPVGRINQVLTRWPAGRVSAPDARAFADALREVLSLGKPHYSDACMSAARELSFRSTSEATLRVYRSVMGAGTA